MEERGREREGRKKERKEGRKEGETGRRKEEEEEGKRERKRRRRGKLEVSEVREVMGCEGSCVFFGVLWSEELKRGVDEF